MSKILILGSDGYIGSVVKKYLFDLGHSVTGVDLKWFSSFKKGAHDFKHLSPLYLDMFDVVINLAGHSSTQACDADPLGSYSNNVTNMEHLLNCLGPKTKLIYASSASVYGDMDEELASELDDLPTPSIHPYDLQKKTIDRMALSSGKEVYGLRFGTVCGYSPNPRNELLINSMVKSAITEGVVRVTNGDSYRSVLGMMDLCVAIRAIVDSSLGASGIYNIASFYDPICKIGERVANMLDCDLEVSYGRGMYSFCMSTFKFNITFGVSFYDTTASIVSGAIHNDFGVTRDWNKINYLKTA